MGFNSEFKGLKVKTRAFENTKNRTNKPYLYVERRSFRAPTGGQGDVGSGEYRCHEERENV
jgi:hypothetical protein